MVTTSEREWFYVPPNNGEQKGPVPAAILTKFLERGVIGPDTLIWKNGLSTWVRMTEAEPFKSTATFQALSWYYVDYENNRHGPLMTRLLLHKLKEGSMDGLTLVYSTLTEGKWKPVREVAELKKELMKIAAEEEAAEQMARVAQEATQQQQQQQAQLFVDDEDVVTQRLNAYKAFQVAQEDVKETASEAAEGKAGGAAGSGGGSRSDKKFIADDGKCY
jgi:hypothetical protein